jgi:general secretion pathway protein D
MSYFRNAGSKYSIIPVFGHSTMKFLLFILCMGLWFSANDSWVMGARVAGEEGATPVAPVPRKKALRPNGSDSSVKTPPRRVPVKLRTNHFRNGNNGGHRNTINVQSNNNNHNGSKHEPGHVAIEFDNVDILIFIKFISELTGKNFVVDKAVRGKVTIISPKKISIKEAYRVFESILEVHGFTTVPAGSIIKIVPAAHARTKNIETRLRKGAVGPEDKVVTQLIPLKYADPDHLKGLFAPLISKSSVIVSYPPTGMLIVTDVRSNIRRLIRIIDVIDVEGIGEEISVVPLEHASATVLAKSLNTVFQRTRKSARNMKKGAMIPAANSLIRIVPDERTNALVISASEDDTLKIRQLIKLLDKETPRGEGDIRVYYLQNANAEDLAKVLTTIPSAQEQKTKKGRLPVVSKEVQIVADKATNSLVITSNKKDYLVLEDVIRKLDVARRMVYIEALIMEVSVEKDFDLGTEWSVGDKLGHHGSRGVGAFGSSTTNPSYMPSVSDTGVVTLPTGFALGVLGEGITIGGIQFPTIGAVIRAYQTDSDIHILSTPQIMTTDNEEAEIHVGENRPFLTRQDTSETGIDYSNYEFKDVGVTLAITPQINQEKFVRLKISQEVSQVVSETVLGLPTTLKRTAKTTVIIKDGNTVVIGGLIDKTMNESTYKVPLLGDIPILGWLFKSKSRSSDKTNLFIFLTPHIIENPAEAKGLYEEKRGQIDSVKEGAIKMYERQPKETPGQEGN